ncbi:integrase core domain-containing protein [Nonomuraea sp. M3C6]|uniref:Integrase core domain-containing protein n=1 Tax=Nonomuraea marmarensis TaxID=3351344 RepID=A0ABW7ARS5_9ACTN
MSGPLATLTGTSRLGLPSAPPSLLRQDGGEGLSPPLETQRFPRRTQAWIESLFGHVKDEHPHLDKITDPYELEAGLDTIRMFYNEVRFHEGIGCVTPDDEHHGRGEVIRAARRAGLKAAYEARVATRRELRPDPLQPLPRLMGI